MGEAGLDLPPSMTVDEFLAWEGDGTDTRYQLIDGELAPIAPWSVCHGGIIANLALHIGEALRNNKSACRVIVGPGVAIGLRARDNVRIPDFGVTCAPAVPGEALLQAPTVLIEVLSPSNKRKIWENARAYASIPSLREILLLQSTRIEAQLISRGPDGHWPAEGVTILDGGEVRLESLDIGYSLRAAYDGTYLV